MVADLDVTAPGVDVLTSLVENSPGNKTDATGAGTVTDADKGHLRADDPTERSEAPGRNSEDGAVMPGITNRNICFTLQPMPCMSK